MSVILKALKSSLDKKEEGGQGDLAPLEEGVFHPGTDVVKAKSDPLAFLRNKRVIVLFALLVFVLAFILVLSHLRSKSKVHEVTTAVQIVPPLQPTEAPPQADVNVAFLDETLKNAKLAYGAGEYEKGVQLFKQAIELKPDDANLYNSLGMAFFKLDLFSNAATSFQKALELDSKCAACFNNFALLKGTLGEGVEAKKYYEKAILLSPEYADPHFNLAVLCEKGGDLLCAVQQYKDFLNLYQSKDDDLVFKVKGRIRELSGK